MVTWGCGGPGRIGNQGALPGRLAVCSNHWVREEEEWRCILSHSLLWRKKSARGTHSSQQAWPGPVCSVCSWDVLDLNKALLPLLRTQDQ
jgi:hypothetical protein